MTNGTVFSGWFEKSRPSPSRTNFRAKIPNKQGNKKMADSLSILLALELLDDYEVEISEVLDKDDDITLFSVGSSYMPRNLNRVRDYFEGTIPFYFPDEFRVTSEFSHYLRKFAVAPVQKWCKRTFKSSVA